MTVVSALALSSSEPPDVAVVDIGLPGVEGYEVAHCLRPAPVSRTISLVAVTSYGQVKDATKALDADFDLHMVKLVEAANSLHTIARLRPLI